MTSRKTGKTIVFPELRQIFCYDCVCCGLACILAGSNIDVREEEIMRIARTTRTNGTDPDGVFRVLRHFKVPYRAGPMTTQKIRDAIWIEHPILLMLQAYRDNPKIPYRDCWNDGHGVVCIGYKLVRNHIYRYTFEDPSSYTRTWLNEPELMIRWHDLNMDGIQLMRWGCEILRKTHFEPGRSLHMA